MSADGSFPRPGEIEASNYWRVKETTRPEDLQQLIRNNPQINTVHLIGTIMTASTRECVRIARRYNLCVSARSATMLDALDALLLQQTRDLSRSRQS